MCSTFFRTRLLGIVSFFFIFFATVYSHPNQLEEMKRSFAHLSISNQAEILKFMGIELDINGRVVGFPTDVTYTHVYRSADFNESSGKMHGNPVYFDSGGGPVLFTDQSRISMPSGENYASPLSARIGYKYSVLISKLVDEKVVRTVWAVNDGKAAHYLKSNEGDINLNIVYADQKNQFEIPMVAIFASQESPLNLESIKSYIDDPLLEALEGSGKIQKGLLTETIEFFPIKFAKDGNEFLVTIWMPSFSLVKANPQDSIKSELK